MVTRVRFCAKCGRPVPNKASYCSDCTADLTAGIQDRCDICGKSKHMSPLTYNTRIKKVYCKDCLNVFVAGLRSKEIPQREINKMLTKDFVPIT
ncbi:MAG: double zinc ribbon domain-containing protein [Candidatus Heimdallarchaeaceae archaeon]